MLHAALLVAALVGSSPAQAQPSPPQVAARVQREDLPALAARVQAAQDKAAARRAFFAGAAPFETAFYDLAGHDLDDPAVVAGLLQLLDSADRSRAVARVAPAPTTGAPRLDAQLATARAGALDAEDADGSLQRRLLLGVQAHLAAHPALGRAALDLHAAPFHQRVRAARALPADATPEARADADRSAALADTELARLQSLAGDLRRTALVPGATAPSPKDDLERLSSPTESQGAAIRLSLLRPFLGQEDAEAVATALLAWTNEGLVAPAQAEHDAAVAARDAVSEAPVPALADAEAALASAIQVLADRDAALAALPAANAGDLLATREREAATLGREAAALRVATAKAMLERAKSVAVEVEAEARRTQVAATEAKAQAAEATRLARDASERRAAALLGDLAEAKEQTATNWEKTQEIEATLQATEQAETERLADLRSRSSAARTLGAFAAERPDPAHRPSPSPEARSGSNRKYPTAEVPS